jgi:hypothetical protein
MVKYNNYIEKKNNKIEEAKDFHLKENVNTNKYN